MLEDRCKVGSVPHCPENTSCFFTWDSPCGTAVQSLYTCSAHSSQKIRVLIASSSCRSRLVRMGDTCLLADDMALVCRCGAPRPSDIVADALEMRTEGVGEQGVRTSRQVALATLRAPVGVADLERAELARWTALSSLLSAVRRRVGFVNCMLLRDCWGEITTYYTDL